MFNGFDQQVVMDAGVLQPLIDILIKVQSYDNLGILDFILFPMVTKVGKCN